MKPKNINYLKTTPYFKGLTYIVGYPKDVMEFDNELSAMEFASKLNYPCGVTIFVILHFDSKRQEEAFFCANSDLRKDVNRIVTPSAKGDVKIECAFARFLYGQLQEGTSGFKYKKEFKKRPRLYLDRF